MSAADNTELVTAGTPALKDTGLRLIAREQRRKSVLVRFDAEVAVGLVGFGVDFLQA